MGALFSRNTISPLPLCASAVKLNPPFPVVSNDAEKDQPSAEVLTVSPVVNLV